VAVPVRERWGDGLRVSDLDIIAAQERLVERFHRRRKQSPEPERVRPHDLFKLLPRGSAVEMAGEELPRHTLVDLDRGGVAKLAPTFRLQLDGGAHAREGFPQALRYRLPSAGPPAHRPVLGEASAQLPRLRWGIGVDISEVLYRVAVR